MLYKFFYLEMILQDQVRQLFSVPVTFNCLMVEKDERKKKNEPLL